MPVPILDTESARTQGVWLLSQVYLGPTSTGNIVVETGNLVYSPTAGFQEVSSVDPITFIPVFKPVNVQNQNATQGDSVIGGTLAAGITKMRVLIDSSRLPMSMSFDRRFLIYNSAAAYVKLFKGTSIEGESLAISAMYNPSGNKTSENIPLEAVYMPNEDNLTVKVPVRAWSSEGVANYDSVTAVVYALDGTVLEVQTFVVYNTDTIATADRSKRYVRSVELISDFISVTDSRMLEYPVGITISSDSLRCRVLYSDGVVLNLPIDGTRVQVYGLNDLLSSESGRSSNLLLSYKLAVDEVGEATTSPTPDRTINVEYRARAITSDSGLIYNVKLFVVPTWIGGSSPRWMLRYFLYSLERMDIFEVTNFIEVAAGSTVFNGTLYSVQQSLGVVLNLQNASGRYRFYRHVQQFKISLNAQGSSRTAPTYWSIEYTPGLVLGQGKKATYIDDPNNAGRRRVRVDSGLSVLAEWINAMYIDTLPLVNTITETGPISPTHVRVRIGETWQRTIPIENILSPIDNVDVTIVQGQDIRLEFVYMSNADIKELSMMSLTLNEL